MKAGEQIQVTGCFTQFKFVAGKPLKELERLIGYHPGRLDRGATLLELLVLPQENQFELFGYSNVATHNFRFPAGLDAEVLKREARKTWATQGPDRLVKVLPASGHNPSLDPDVQYPHAAGIPQWALKRNVFLPARVLAILSA